MCRSIKTLRPPVIPEEATEEDIRAAALQFVRKVSGFRAPAAHNQEVFDRAVDEIAEATARLLDGLEVRGARQDVLGAEAAAGAVAGVAAAAPGRRIRYAASAPATNRASTETAVPSHVVPSHWPPK